jgi:outer membrane receptor for ferrienterochelin and colicin
MRHLKLLKGILFILLMLSYLFSFSQVNCGKATINEVMLKYEIGQFKESIDQLNSCLKANGFSVDEKVEAYRLLAMSQLAIDSLKQADISINQLLFLKDNFEPDSRDPERFKFEVNIVKSMSRTNIVSSVSKRNEELRLAPATILVITKQEITERGYNDIIDILKDVPGFDLSIYYGVLYANIYQRGLRSNNSEKTLILVDGVEDNNLWTNYADISQQYPLSNIKRVEIIYGPASTMYGANAFTGVINIITKEPEDFLKKNHTSGVSAQTGIGSYGSKFADVSYAYKKGQVSFTLTGRGNISDRPDLSAQTLYDYDPAVYDNKDYSKLLSITKNAQSYITNNKLPLSSPNYNIFGAPGAADSIILTAQGVNLARSLDKGLYTKSIRGLPVNKFTSKTNSNYLHAKLNISDFSFGFVRWTKLEGMGTLYTDQFASSAGTNWNSTQQYAYINYEKRINSNLSVYSSSSYKIHTIDNGSEITLLNNYARVKKELKDLENNVQPDLVTTNYFEQSKQFRTEAKVMYTWNKNLYLISGVELRNGQIQGNYVTSLTSNVPQDLGSASPATPGGNQYDVKDFGIYSQGGYRSKSGFGATVGIRMDKNKIGKSGGFGTEISPRFVLDYSTKTFVVKAIYSRGIMNVSNFTKFAVAANRIANPTLRTESINNFEFSLNKQFTNSLSADIDFYFSPIQDVVGTVNLPGGMLQNQNIGKFKIFGIQQNLNYTIKKFKAILNYYYVSPKQTQSEVGAVDNAVGDIANHHVNTIFNYLLNKHVNLNFKTNYVGVKKVGLNTTVPANPAKFNSYTVSGLTIGFINIINNLNVQLVCNNIFSKTYFSPGIRLADGFSNPSEILQMGRNWMFRINYDF